MFFRNAFGDLDQRLTKLFDIYLFAELGDNANIVRFHFPATSIFIFHVASFL